MNCYEARAGHTLAVLMMAAGSLVGCGAHDSSPGGDELAYGEGLSPAMAAPATVNAADKTPIGWLDYVGPDQIYGWSCDQDTPTVSNKVHLYIGGPAGDTAKHIAGLGPTSVANEPAVTAACGGGTLHRFKWTVPDAVKTKLGVGDFPVYAYGLNTSPNGLNSLLSGSPKNLHIAAPPGAVHKPYLYASWSPYCDRGIDNLCNAPELNRDCQTQQQWETGWYDYQNLCNNEGGADFICTRGVDNLCNVPELGRQCAGGQWTEGFYEYIEICGTQSAACGSQAQQLSGTLLTDLTAHPPAARTDPSYNIKVYGYQASNDAADFSVYGGCADYSAPNLTDLWPNRSRPSPFFGQQYRLNEPGQPGALVTGLKFAPCQDVYLPMTGLPGQMGPGMSCCATGICNGLPATCKGQLGKPPYGDSVPHARVYIHGSPGDNNTGNDFQAQVIYADASTVTVQYTRADGPYGPGYILYVDNLDVNPAIISAYQASNYRGRGDLPALPPGARLGRARGEIRVVFRDTASWMDARSRKDWWADTYTVPTTQYACFGD